MTKQHDFRNHASVVMVGVGGECDEGKKGVRKPHLHSHMAFKH